MRDWRVAHRYTIIHGYLITINVNYKIFKSGFLGFYSFFLNTALSAAPQIALCLRMLEFEPRTVATLALTVRRSNNSARSHPDVGFKIFATYTYRRDNTSEALFNRINLLLAHRN